jgi:hypothetical protein
MLGIWLSNSSSNIDSSVYTYKGIGDVVKQLILLKNLPFLKARKKTSRSVKQRILQDRLWTAFAAWWGCFGGPANRSFLKRGGFFSRINIQHLR